jgi:UDP:flavonoid glycosyltransferase YjiC (YdhE family)
LKPLIVVPHGRDQADNAVRVTERGAGLALPPSASVDEIRAALEQLLGDPAFKAAATQLGGAIAQEAANSPVVALLEDLVAAPVQRRLCLA